MTTSLKWISSLATAAAMSLTAFASNAAELVANDVPTRVVKAWDLDLAKPNDVQTLYRRLQDAAMAVCEAEAERNWQNTRFRAPPGWTDRCVDDALNGAVRSTENRRLAVAHSPGTTRL